MSEEDPSAAELTRRPFSSASGVAVLVTHYGDVHDARAATERLAQSRA
jgi:hypothetical protein